MQPVATTPERPADSAATAGGTAAPIGATPPAAGNIAGNTPPAGSARARRWRRALAYGAGALALAALGGLAGWQGPRLLTAQRADFYGEPAAEVATALGCADYAKDQAHDESVYQFHDRGSCVFEGTKVTITTFDDAADVQAFTTLRNGIIPLLHPTWQGAATAVGDGWEVAATDDLSAATAEAVVRQLGAGGTHVIPAAKR